ncbi:MAG: tRNA (guanine-N1)-methyltransferase [Cyanobacteria bacterium J06648_16]
MMATSDWVEEGQARFRIGEAFYRPKSKIGRDLAVLAAATYRRQRGELRVLDAMTGCGVRSLRYQLEADADWVWANEGNPELRAVLAENLSVGMRPRSFRVTHQDANQLFFSCYQQRDFYDLVDIDSFGNPTPFLQTGLWATKVGGLLYLTSTDGRTTGGHAPDKSLQVYGAYARSHPAVHEQGLRLLIGSVAQQAASRGMHIEPVFSLFNGQIHRVMVRLVMRKDWDSDQYGFLAYCHGCGQFQTVSWRQLGRVGCTCQPNLPSDVAINPPVVSGPLWLGPLHDVAFLQKMEGLAEFWGWAAHARLIQLMVREAKMPPYYYPLGEIGRRGKLDIPQREQLIQALQEAGYRATRTHVEAQAIKTDAPIAECIQAAKALASHTPL